MNDNQLLRELFTLPPIQASASTAIAVPEMPPQQTVTGDSEVDAVLWLQSVIKTGNQALIDKALEASEHIKTPMKELESRYAKHVGQANPGNPFAALIATMDFGDFKKIGQQSIAQAKLKHEALSRFGDEEALFSNTPAEDACVCALHNVTPNERHGFSSYNDAEVAEAFAESLKLVPGTISDCMYVMEYHNKLYRLRNATVTHTGDPLPQAYAHEQYCFAMLAQIAPRDATEAMQALEYLQAEERNQSNEAPAIYRNLVASGWDARAMVLPRAIIDAIDKLIACAKSDGMLEAVEISPNRTGPAHKALLALLQNQQQNIPEIIPAPQSSWNWIRDIQPPMGVPVLCLDDVSRPEYICVATRDCDWAGDDDEPACFWWMHIPPVESQDVRTRP